jgi:hypothetical protein
MRLGRTIGPVPAPVARERKPMKKFALVGALAALTIGAAACGGGSDTLSEDDYINELEDICSRADGDLRDIEDPEDFRAIVDAADDAISITSDAIDDINELEPPDDLEGDHEDFVAALEDVVSGFEELRDAADDEDEEALSQAGENIAEASADADNVAEDLDADDCIGVGEEGEEPDDPDEPTETTIEDEPTETTVEDEPTDTTEPDEPTETTVDETIPRITVPPIDMTMPADTEPPVMEGSEIGTIDIVNDLPLPVGYTFENADSETLTNIQSLYAEAFTGQIQAIGGAGVVDDVTGEVFSAFVFFWNAELDDATGQAFVDDLAAADDVASTEVVTTPSGLIGDRILYTDQTEALIVWGGNVSVVLFGDPGSAASLATLVDAIAAA